MTEADPVSRSKPSVSRSKSSKYQQMLDDDEEEDQLTTYRPRPTSQPEQRPPLHTTPSLKLRLNNLETRRRSGSSTSNASTKSSARTNTQSYTHEALSAPAVDSADLLSFDAKPTTPTRAISTPMSTLHPPVPLPRPNRLGEFLKRSVSGVDGEKSPRNAAAQRKSSATTPAAATPRSANGQYSASFPINTVPDLLTGASQSFATSLHNIHGLQSALRYSTNSHRVVKRIASLMTKLSNIQMRAAEQMAKEIEYERDKMQAQESQYPFNDILPPLYKQLHAVAETSMTLGQDIVATSVEPLNQLFAIGTDQHQEQQQHAGKLYETVVTLERQLQEQADDASNAIQHLLEFQITHSQTPSAVESQKSQLFGMHSKKKSNDPLLQRIRGVKATQQQQQQTSHHRSNSKENINPSVPVYALPTTVATALSQLPATPGKGNTEKDAKKYAQQLEKLREKCIQLCDKYAQTQERANTSIKPLVDTDLHRMLTHLQSMEEVRLASLRSSLAAFTSAQIQHKSAMLQPATEIENISSQIQPTAIIQREIQLATVDSDLSSQQSNGTNHRGSVSMLQPPATPRTERNTMSASTKETAAWSYQLPLTAAQLRSPDWQLITGDLITIRESLKLSPFNTPLPQLVAALHHADDQYSNTFGTLPRVVTALIDACEGSNGLTSEGIYRLSSDTQQQQNMKQQLDSGNYDALFASTSKSPYLYASLLKQWLRETPTPLIPYMLYDTCIEIGKMTEDTTAQDGTSSPAAPKSSGGTVRQKILQFVTLLPDLNTRVLAFIFQHVQRLLLPANSSITKMTAYNMAVVLSPGLVRSRSDDPMVLLQDTKYATKFIEYLIAHSTAAFAANAIQLSTMLMSTSIAKNSGSGSSERKQLGGKSGQNGASHSPRSPAEEEFVSTISTHYSTIDDMVTLPDNIVMEWDPETGETIYRDVVTNETYAERPT